VDATAWLFAGWLFAVAWRQRRAVGGALAGETA
jgi:hypothetical protein